MQELLSSNLSLSQAGLGLRRFYHTAFRSVPELINEGFIDPKIAIPFRTLDLDPDADVSWTLSKLGDQLNTPKCVAFAGKHYLGSRPHVIDKSNKLTTDQLYFGAQDNDEWMGRDYEGTSATGLMRYLIRHPQVDVKSFVYLEGPDLVRKMIAYLEKFGPLMIGASRLENMMIVDKNGYIHVEGQDYGGHETLYYGYHLAFNKIYSKSGGLGTINYDRSYFREANSWGPNWGVRGRCKITFTEFLKLEQLGIDVVAPTKEVK